LPIKGYLKKGEDDSFHLENLDAQFTLDRIVAENYSLKIVLPEGAENVKAKIGDNILTLRKANLCV
jgi:HSP20 family molecular chaperone IbpA